MNNVKVEDIKAFALKRKPDIDGAYLKNQKVMQDTYNVDADELDGGFTYFHSNGCVYRITTGVECMFILTGNTENYHFGNNCGPEGSERYWDLNDVIGGYYCGENNKKIPVIRHDIEFYIDKEDCVHFMGYDFINFAIQSINDVRYVPLSTWAEKVGKSVPAAKRQCQLSRVKGAVSLCNNWFVPIFAEYPDRTQDSVLEVPYDAIDDTLRMKFLSGVYDSIDCPFTINKNTKDEDVLFEISVDCDEEDLDEFFKSMGEDNTIYHRMMVALFKIAHKEHCKKLYFMNPWTSTFILTFWKERGYPLSGDYHDAYLMAAFDEMIDCDDFVRDDVSGNEWSNS